MSGPRRLPAAAAILCWAAIGSASALEPGDHRFELRAGGVERSYIVHLPPDRDARPAVVLNFHGGGGNARQYQAYVLMDGLADREGFVVVYPNGSGVLRERLLTWNAGGCCGYALRTNVDDVDFVRSLLEDLGARVAFDPKRVYATGLSNGAMMSYRLAAELPESIAAIAPVGGAMMLGSDPPPHAKPVLHIHSVDDHRALYAGGLGAPFPFTNVRVLHPSVEARLALWAKTNGCAGALQPAARREWVDAAGRPHTATLLRYAACRVETALWRLSGAGHVWPGGRLDYLPVLLGPGTRVIDANEEIWRFFRRHRLGAPSARTATGLRHVKREPGARR
ncbi:MAG: alpha/beta fold hydrolase [Burkholderiales bacterium]|nr:alpha/beta fold hydrolase [Burkholderiales bacterium]